MARLTVKVIMDFLQQEQDRLTKACENLSRELAKAERGEKTLRNLTEEQLERRWMMNENKLVEVETIRSQLNAMMRREKQ